MPERKGKEVRAMGIYRRRMEARRQREEARRQLTRRIIGLVVAVVVLGGIVVGLVTLQQQRTLGQQPAKAPVAAQPVDMFAGLTPLLGAEVEAGLTLDAFTRPTMARWLQMSNRELGQHLEHALAVNRPGFLEANPEWRGFDWNKRLHLPVPQPAPIADRGAVIVGQAHVLRGPQPGSVQLPLESVTCQREIYRYLLYEQQQRSDMTLLHEGVAPSHPVRAGDIDQVSSVASYVASIQFALRHPAVEQLPSEDDAVLALDTALNDTPMTLGLNRWPAHQQIIVEMRSRAMAQQIAIALNRGRTPFLVAGDAHEVGVANALNGAGYKAVIWQPTPLRRSTAQEGR